MDLLLLLPILHSLSIGCLSLRAEAFALMCCCVDRVSCAAASRGYQSSNVTALAVQLIRAPRRAADIISAVEFDWDGRHLATGDRGGRVVLFEQVPTQPVRARCCAGGSCAALLGIMNNNLAGYVLRPDGGHQATAAGEPARLQARQVTWLVCKAPVPQGLPM